MADAPNSLYPPVAEKLPGNINIQIAFFTLSRMVLNTSVRMMYPFLAVFARGLGVSVEQISLALSARSLIGALNPFMATISDRQGRKYGMMLGLGIFFASNLLVVIWRTYPAFFIALGGGMLGNFIFLSSMQAFLGDIIPYQKRGRYMAIIEMGWSFSFIFIMPIIALLISRLGWSAPFIALALSSLIIYIFMAWKLPKTTPTSSQKGHSWGWKTIRQVLNYAPARAGLAMAIFFSAANEMVNLLFGVWLEDSFGLKIAALGAASVVVGLSEFGGESLTAGLVDRLGKERSIRWGLLLNCLCAIMLYYLGGNLWTALAGLFFFYITFEYAIVSCLPLISEIMPEARATLLGLNISAYAIGRALGALVAPYLYQVGFGLNITAAVLLNLAAILVLRSVKIRSNRDIG